MKRMHSTPELPAAIWGYILNHRTLQHEAQRASKQQLNEFRDMHSAEHWEWLSTEILIAGASMGDPVRRRVIWATWR